MVTTGWVPKGVPAVALPGSVVKTSWLAGPTATVNGPDVAPVSDPSEAVSVYPLAAVSIEQPVKVVTPPDGVPAHPVSAPGPEPTAESHGRRCPWGTVFPPASSTATTGCVVKAGPSGGTGRPCR